MTCSSWKVREGEIGKGVGIDCTNHNSVISRGFEKNLKVYLWKSFWKGKYLREKNPIA